MTELTLLKLEIAKRKEQHRQTEETVLYLKELCSETSSLSQECKQTILETISIVETHGRDQASQLDDLEQLDHALALLLSNAVNQASARFKRPYLDISGSIIEAGHVLRDIVMDMDTDELHLGETEYEVTDDFRLLSKNDPGMSARSIGEDDVYSGDRLKFVVVAETKPITLKHSPRLVDLDGTPLFAGDVVSSGNESYMLRRGAQGDTYLQKVERASDGSWSLLPDRAHLAQYKRPNSNVVMLRLEM